MSESWEKSSDTALGHFDKNEPTQQLASHVKVHKRLYDQLSKEEVRQYIHERIAHDFVHMLLESGLIQITNLTAENEIHASHQYDQEITYEGKLKLTISPRGANVLEKFQKNYGTTPDVKVVYKDQFTQEQLDYIWKMLPPRINKRDPKQHPLHHGWFGTIERPGDEHIRKTLAEALKQYI